MLHYEVTFLVVDCIIICSETTEVINCKLYNSSSSTDRFIFYRFHLILFKQNQNLSLTSLSFILIFIEENNKISIILLEILFNELPISFFLIFFYT